MPIGSEGRTRKLVLRRRLFRIDAFGNKFLGRHAHAQALIRARAAVRNRRGNEHDFTGIDFDDAAFAFDLRAPAELQINQIMIRGAGELRLAAGDMFRGDSQTVAFEYRRARAIAGKRRAAQEIERSNLAAPFFAPCGRCR